MKYTRLSKEQFESLHQEFSLFLASQSINKKEWDQIKRSNAELTDQLLDLFSDMVWDESLEKITYLENRSSHHLFLFKCQDSRIDLILIQLEKDCPSLLSENYKIWLSKNISSPSVSIFESSRTFDESTKEEKFKLLKKGASVVDGKTFEDFKRFLLK